MTLDNICADFEFLDDWEDRYRYVIELSRSLSPLPDSARTEANKVRGCASQVWLTTDVDAAAGANHVRRNDRRTPGGALVNERNYFGGHGVSLLRCLTNRLLK